MFSNKYNEWDSWLKDVNINLHRIIAIDISALVLFTDTIISHTFIDCGRDLRNQ